MQTLVSVKNPYDSPALMVVAISERHQVGDDLGEAAVARVQVERDGAQLVDDRHRAAVARDVHAQQVTTARLACLDAHVREDGALRRCPAARQPTNDAAALARRGADLAEDRQPAGRILATARTGHTR